MKRFVALRTAEGKIKKEAEDTNIFCLNH